MRSVFSLAVASPARPVCRRSRRRFSLPSLVYLDFCLVGTLEHIGAYATAQVLCCQVTAVPMVALAPAGGHLGWASRGRPGKLPINLTQSSEDEAESGGVPDMDIQGGTRVVL